MGVLHDIGQLAGHALNAAPGYSTIGAQITNPDVNYLGKANPGTPANNYYGNPPKSGSKTKAATTLTTPTTTVPGGSATTDPYAAERASYIGQGQNALQTALDALTKGNESAQTGYTTANNQLNSQNSQAQATEGSQLNQDAQGFSTAAQQAREQGSSDYNSLQRALAALGAGSSTVASQLVPHLVEQSVQSNVGGANHTKAANDQTATSAYNSWLTGEYNTGLEKNKDALANAEATNKADYGRETNALNLAIKALKGGSNDVPTEGSNIMSTLGSIPNPIVPASNFTGNVAAFTPAQLASFELNPSTISSASGQVASGGTTLPLLAAIQQQKKQQAQAQLTPAS